MNTSPTSILRRGQGLWRSTKLWLAWILASAVGYSFGIGIPGGCLFVLLIMIQGGMWYDASVVEVWAIYLAFLVPASVIGGLVVGRIQVLVLGRRLERPRTWVLWTAVAWISVGLAPIILVYLSESEGDVLPLLVLIALVIGATVGTGQWAALRRTVKAAEWWIPVSTMAWVLGVLTGDFLRSLAIPGAEISMMVAVVVAEIMISIVTGLALVVLLEPTRQGWLNAAILTGLSAVLALGVPFSLINGFSQQSKTLRTGYFVDDLAFCADGTRLAALGFTNTEGEGDWLSVWDAANWKLVGKIAVNGGESSRRIALSPDGKVAITGGTQAWDVSSSEQLWSVGDANDVVFSPDGEWVALAYGDYASGWIEIRVAATGSERLRIPGQGQLYIDRLAFSPDGRFLASGSGPASDFTVRQWDATTGRYLQGFPGLVPGVEALAFLPGKHVLIAGGGNGRGEYGQPSLRMWDLQTGSDVTSVDLTDTVQDLAISPDGKWIAVVLGYPDYDPKIYLYDVATGELMRVLKGHTDKVTSLQFSPDGRYLASGSHDKTVRLWEIGAQTPAQP